MDGRRGELSLQGESSAWRLEFARRGHCLHDQAIRAGVFQIFFLEILLLALSVIDFFYS
jgi:hypothetical protein